MTSQFGLPDRVVEWKVIERVFPDHRITAHQGDDAVVIYGKHVVVSTPGVRLSPEERDAVVDWLSGNTPADFSYPVVFTDRR